MDQYTEEIFNMRYSRVNQKSCKVLSSPLLEVVKEMLKNHLSVRVTEGIPERAGSLPSSVWCLLCTAGGIPSDFR